MLPRSILWLLLAFFSSSLPALGDEPKKDGSPYDPTPFARRVWVVTDAVLQHHVEPPARSVMVLAAAQALLKKAELALPADLERLAAEAATPEALARLLRQLWPATDKTPAEEVEEAVLEAVLKAVPGGAHLMVPHEMRAAEQIEGNRYVGTGIQIALPQGEKFAQIRLAFPRGPARRAGAKNGDLILAVDGVNLEGATIRRAVEVLRGEEGTPCTMVVRQPDSTETRTLHMIRGIVPFETVLGYRRLSEEDWEFRPDRDAPIAYLRISSMTSSCLHELRQVERKLQGDGFRGLVLDLRFSNGGTVHNAALLADGLLDGGVLWRTREGRKPPREYVADRDCLFRDWPIAVLVHDFMPPGSIWVAAALQDHRRAVLVGDPKRGDHAGYRKDVVRLPDNQGALQFRTGLVERITPGGWTLKAKERVTLTDDQQKALREWYYQQEQPQGKPGEQPPGDPQLARAIEVLKAGLQKQVEVQEAR